MYVYGVGYSSMRGSLNRSVNAAAERRGKDLTGFEDFDLKAKARIWPSLAGLFQVRKFAVLAADMVRAPREREGVIETRPPIILFIC